MPVIIILYTIVGALTYGLAHERCADAGNATTRQTGECQFNAAAAWPIYWPYRAGLALSL